MEYLEFISEFFNHNKIDSNSINLVIELFDISRDISFLLEDNLNIKEAYSSESMSEIRNRFIQDQKEELNKFINNLLSLKTISNENTLRVIELLISSNKLAENQLNTTQVITKESLIFKHENNRKLILLALNKEKEIEERFKINNKSYIIQNLKNLLNKLINICMLGPNPSLKELKDKIDKDYNSLDFDYLEKINESTLNEVKNNKNNINTKEEAHAFLNVLYKLNSAHNKPINNHEDILKIRELEERIYSLNLYNYLEKSQNSDRLKPYNLLLKEQLETIYIEVDSIEKRKKYLSTLSNMLNTITSLNEKIKPLKVGNGIFDYNVESFDSVKTIKMENNIKWVMYRRGTQTSYSIIENREIILRELDYWEKETNSGFDRYDKEDLIKKIDEILNFIKLYYKYRSYIMYMEVSNKIFNFEGSKNALNKDKKALDEVKEHLMKNIENIKILGMSYYEKEIDIENLLSKYTNIEKEVIFSSIIPSDGIGRCIESFEMLKIIYGLEYVRNNIIAFENKKEN